MTIQQLMRFKMSHGLWFARRVDHGVRGVSFNEIEPKLEDFI